jgi:competence protein ComEC
VIKILRQFITGSKEQGFAEALLIGYKDDLDKNLVQAYSNTGVVHIIAISGLHLGLIYGLLLLLTKPLKRVRKLLWLRLVLLIGSLWLFSILAGGGPSVLRSALMFSLIALGEVALRKTVILNTLAFSAFVLLCINPFWLWDVGFQLSYAAVLSIVLFFQPIYRWFQFDNKAVDFVWKLTAVTIAAQILTLPISIYHFHQMPLLFLVTNFIAVPLSSVILFGEILLCALFFLPAVSTIIGKVLHSLIAFLNSYIEGLNSLPFATWNFLSVSLVQTVLLLVFALAFCYWLLEKQRRFAWLAFASFGLFMLLRGASFYAAFNQKQLIVYNVPKHPAIDIIDGRRYYFVGDSLLLSDGFERNFHLQPSRILHRISPQQNDVGVKQFALAGKQVLILNEALPFAAAEPKQTIDVLVLSGNPKLYISRLLHSFSIRQVVIDGSVPSWKAALWKKDCDSLHVSCYNVSEDGAFVMNW